MRIPYYQYFQLLSLLSCILFYKGVRKQRMEGFLPLCAIMLTTEVLAANIKLMGLSSNHFLLNIYLNISAPLYFYIFYRILNITKKYKKVYIIFSLGTTLMFLCNYFFFEGPVSINTFSIILEQTFTVLLSCSLLFHLATNEKYFVLSEEPYFWIGAGLLIFSLGALVVLGMNQYIRINNLTIKNKSLYKVIMPVLNVVLSLSYTYAFYLCRPKKKSFSPL